MKYDHENSPIIYDSAFVTVKHHREIFLAYARNNSDPLHPLVETETRDIYYVSTPKSFKMTYTLEDVKKYLILEGFEFDAKKI